MVSCVLPIMPKGSGWTSCQSRARGPCVVALLVEPGPRPDPQVRPLAARRRDSCQEPLQTHRGRCAGPPAGPCRDRRCRGSTWPRWRCARGCRGRWARRRRAASRSGSVGPKRELAGSSWRNAWSLTTATNTKATPASTVRSAAAPARQLRGPALQGPDAAALMDEADDAEEGRGEEREGSAVGGLDRGHQALRAVVGEGAGDAVEDRDDEQHRCDPDPHQPGAMPRTEVCGRPDDAGIGDEHGHEAGQDDHDVDGAAGSVGRGDGDRCGRPQDGQDGREQAHEAAVGRVIGHRDGSIPPRHRSPRHGPSRRPSRRYHRRHGTHLRRDRHHTGGSRRGQRLAPPFVSLLSDFGLRDPSAGIMRAVVVGICPRASIVDLAHDVSKFAIRDGALLLWSAVPYLPIGVHVAVVDPGVGTARKGIAIADVARGLSWWGPTTACSCRPRPGSAASPMCTCWRTRATPCRTSPAPSTVATSSRRPAPTSPTGVPIEELGRAVDPRRLLELEWPRPEIGPGRLRAQAIYIDTFGNVKLSALADDLATALPGLRFGERLAPASGHGARRARGGRDLGADLRRRARRRAAADGRLVRAREPRGAPGLRRRELRDGPRLGR